MAKTRATGDHFSEWIMVISAGGDKDRNAGSQAASERSAPGFGFAQHDGLDQPTAFPRSPPSYGPGGVRLPYRGSNTVTRSVT